MRLYGRCDLALVEVKIATAAIVEMRGDGSMVSKRGGDCNFEPTCRFQFFPTYLVLYSPGIRLYDFLMVLPRYVFFILV